MVVLWRRIIRNTSWGVGEERDADTGQTTFTSEQLSCTTLLHILENHGKVQNLGLIILKHIQLVPLQHRHKFKIKLFKAVSVSQDNKANVTNVKST